MDQRLQDVLAETKAVFKKDIVVRILPFVSTGDGAEYLQDFGR